MSERDFWLIVRRALLMLIRAIEQRYGVVVPIQESGIVTFTG